jgi:hypothetical protein
MAAHDAKVSGSPSGDEDPDDTFYPGLLALWDELTREEVADFQTALGTAREERDLQSFLEKHPRLLIQQLTTGRRSWVIPKKRLGSEHETDFVIAQRASDGYVWTAVELESPRVKMFNKNGDQSAALTHALRQVDDWREWLSQNRDYAARPRERSGLGLTDIHSDLEGMVIIGRDADFDRRATAARRRRLERAHRVKIETYDWLLAQASDRLMGLEKKARDIMGKVPVSFALINTFLDSRTVPLPEAEQVVTDVFGRISSGWTAPSTVRDEIEWDGVEIWPDPDGMDNNVVVPFKIVYTRGTQANRLLQTGDWEDWSDYVTNTLQNDFGLLITEIAPDERLQNGLLLTREGVWCATWYPRDVAEQRYGSLRVLVYLPPDASYNEKRSRVAEAREGFQYLIPDPALEREREAEEEREAEHRIRSLSLAPDDEVNHDKFGEGIVVSISGEGLGTEATIDFGLPWGYKHLVLRYAPIEKL